MVQPYQPSVPRDPTTYSKNSRPTQSLRWRGVTITVVHAAETNVATTSAAMITTRSKTPNKCQDRHFCSGTSKAISYQLLEKRHNITKDLQEELNTLPQNLNVKQILDDTNVTITLPKLIKLSLKLQRYLQQAATPQWAADLANV